MRSRKVALLVDIRHDPSVQDVQMYEWLKHYGYAGLIVATKSDKVSRNETQKKLAAIRRVLGASENDVIIPVSTLKKTGVDLLSAEIEKLL